jgi:hypothetical protein
MAGRQGRGVVSARELPQLIDAAELARRLSVDRSWVYDHADELGAMPLGDGARPRLRFDPAAVYERLAAASAPATRPKRAASRRGATTGQNLLPIKGGT